MSKIKLSCGLVLLSIFAGCSSTSNVAPEWVTNPEALYSSRDYLWAVGSGGDKKGSENDALSLLAQSIQQNVVATTEARKTLDGNEDAGYNVGYDYSGQVMVVSNIKDIPGVAFPKTWIAGNGTVYTLALLNRQEAGRFYRQKISDLTAVVESEIIFATNNEGTFKAFAALQNATEAAWENQGYVDTLAGIHPDMYRMVSLDYVSAQAVEVLAARQKEKILVAVDVDGDSNGRIASILESSLTELGLNVFEGDEATAAYLLHGNIVMEPLDYDNKYEYVRFVIDIDLIEKETGKTLFPYSKNGREAHVTHGEAVQRAYRTLEDALEDEFVPQFVDFMRSSAG